MGKPRRSGNSAEFTRLGCSADVDFKKPKSAARFFGHFLIAAKSGYNLGGGPQSADPSPTPSL